MFCSPDRIQTPSCADKLLNFQLITYFPSSSRMSCTPPFPNPPNSIVISSLILGFWSSSALPSYLCLPSCLHLHLSRSLPFLWVCCEVSHRGMKTASRCLPSVTEPHKPCRAVLCLIGVSVKTFSWSCDMGVIIDRQPLDVPSGRSSSRGSWN